MRGCAAVIWGICKPKLAVLGSFAVVFVRLCYTGFMVNANNCGRDVFLDESVALGRVIGSVRFERRPVARGWLATGVLGGCAALFGLAGSLHATTMMTMLHAPGGGDREDKAAAQVDLLSDDADSASAGCLHCQHSRMMMRRFTAGPGVRSADAPEAVDDTDVLNYEISLEPNFTSSTLVGTVKLTVRTTVDAVSEMEIELHPNFTVTSAIVKRPSDGAAAGWPATLVRSFGASDPRLTVTLPAAVLPLSRDAVFTLEISYNGAPANSIFGGTEFTMHNNNTQPIVYTLVEPWYSHTWIPVKEKNSDKATVSIAVTVPNTMKVAANGVRQGIDALAGGRSRHRWVTNYQTSPYLICFAATNYTEFGSTWMPAGGGPVMPLQFFIYPENDTTANRTAWLQLGDMLTVYSAKFGIYPFAAEKYGICQLPFNGGMEHQTMTGQGTFNSSVNAHEVAHQWFGNMITCDRWNDIWLNESFATYAEALWRENAPGSSGTPALIAAMANRRPSTVNGSVYVYDLSNPNALFSTLQYRKGGWVLHMLRHMVGDATFFGILAEYRNQFAYRTARTEDFIAVCEQVAGRNLQTFFQPWIFGIGAPSYRWSWRPVTVGGQNYAEVYLQQTQQSGYPLFPMPIDVELTSGAGILTVAASNTHLQDWVLVPLGQVPTGARLDPNSYVLETGKTQVATASFPAGPPKLVAASILPGAASAASALPLNVTFHSPILVGVGAAELSRVGAATAVVQLTAAGGANSYSVGGTTGLVPGRYTVRLRADRISGVVGQLALDGEVPGSTMWTIGTAPTAPLPSGDGAPGGDAVWSFDIVRPASWCLADIAGAFGPDGAMMADGTVDGSDFVAFINSFGIGDATVDGEADLVGIVAADGSDLPDGVIDGSDFVAFINAFAAGC